MGKRKPAHKHGPAHAGPQRPPPASPGNGAAHVPGSHDDATRRAEQMIDQFADQVGRYTAVLGKKLLRMSARAREEAEDIWAEAQDLRHGQRRQPHREKSGPS